MKVSSAHVGHHSIYFNVTLVQNHINILKFTANRDNPRVLINCCNESHNLILQLGCSSG